MNQSAEEIQKTLEQASIPVSAAERASKVLAKDDALLPNLGRSEQDQKDISDAFQWYWAKQKGVTN